MKIRVYNTLENDVYKPVIYTEDWSEGDLKLMKLFGEPEIELGGIFTGPPLFTMPTEYVKIATESPFSQAFDARDHADADDRADIWKLEIKTRIIDAVTDLRLLSDTFTGEEVFNV